MPKNKKILPKTHIRNIVLNYGYIIPTEDLKRWKRKKTPLSPITKTRLKK